VGNIKIDLREIGWDGTDWIDLAQDRDQWRALLLSDGGMINEYKIKLILEQCLPIKFGNGTLLHSKNIYGTSNKIHKL
jgi:hypothetical protein